MQVFLVFGNIHRNVLLLFLAVESMAVEADDLDDDGLDDLDDGGLDDDDDDHLDDDDDLSEGESSLDSLSDIEPTPKKQKTKPDSSELNRFLKLQISVVFF